MSPTTKAGVVERLVDLDLVDFDDPGPWPGPPGDDVYACDVDWERVHGSDDLYSEDDLYRETALDAWARARAAITGGSGGGFADSPPILDAAAWYLPLHYFGTESAIYIKESAVVQAASGIFQHLPESRRRHEGAVHAVVRVALSMIYLHEAFHHKVESFTIRLEVIERQRRFLPYHRNVFLPLREGNPDALLEEALGSAEMHRRLTEPVYKKGVPPDVRAAARNYLPTWLSSLGPPYVGGTRLTSERAFVEALDQLSGQIHSGRQVPDRDPRDWALFDNGYRGLFNCQRITHVLVPIGSDPVIPWFTPAYRGTISTDEMMRVLTRDWGYSEQKRRGKGSHTVLKAPGRGSITLPGNRRDLSPGVVRNVADTLGIRPHELPGLSR